MLVPASIEPVLPIPKFCNAWKVRQEHISQFCWGAVVIITPTPVFPPCSTRIISCSLFRHVVDPTGTMSTTHVDSWQNSATPRSYFIKVWDDSDALVTTHMQLRHRAKQLPKGPDRLWHTIHGFTHISVVELGCSLEPTSVYSSDFKSLTDELLSLARGELRCRSTGTNIEFLGLTILYEYR